MNPHYDSSGVYAIHVDGRLDATWSDRLGGLFISTVEADDDSGRPQTVLKGYLPDQAALFGILNTLYNNRYPVTLVRYLRPYPENAIATPDDN